MSFLGVFWCTTLFWRAFGDPITHESACNSSRLHQAILKLDSAFLKDALGNGKDFYLKDCNGLTPMELALHRGHDEAVYALLERSFDLDAVDAQGDTILIRAVRRGSKYEVEKLTDFGSTMDFVNSVGSTPLLEALLAGRDDLVGVLLKAGAKLDWKLPGGNSYLHRVVDLGNFRGALEVLKLKVPLDVENDQGETPLARAVLKNNAAFVNLLASRGANLGGSNSLKNSYLHLAAKENSLEVIPALLRRGIKVDKETNSGKTPLFYAVLENNTEVIRLLLESKADLDRLNENGLTYLHMAGKNRTLLKQFLDIGVWPDLADKHGKTLMYCAVEWDDTDVMDLLHEYGSDLQQTVWTFYLSAGAVKQNTTLIHLAAVSGSSKAIEWLVRHGADVDAKSQSYTPLDAAINSYAEICASKLIELGACGDFEANDCQRSYELALSRGLEVVAKLILEKKQKL